MHGSAHFGVAAHVAAVAARAHEASGLGDVLLDEEEKIESFKLAIAWKEGIRSLLLGGLVLDFPGAVTFSLACQVLAPAIHHQAGALELFAAGAEACCARCYACSACPGMLCLPRLLRTVDD